MTLHDRNERAFASAQWAYDHMAPPEPSEDAQTRIEDAFGSLGGKDATGRLIHARDIAVEYESRGRVKTRTLHEAIADDLLMSETQAIENALFKVLEESRCEHVKALRDALCAEWVSMHARDIEAVEEQEAYDHD